MKQIGMGLLFILLILVYGKERVMAEQAKKPIYINPPGKIIYRAEEWNGNSALKATYLKDKEFAKLTEMSFEEFDSLYGYEEYAAYIVFDWSIDNENNWHYDRTWDQEEKFSAPLFCQVGESAINTAEVFWFSYQQQCSYFEDCIQPGADMGSYVFDYDNHTLYIRAKYVVELRNGHKYEERISSGWSGISSIDKDTALDEPVLKELAPTIKNGKVNSAGSSSCINFSLEAGEELVDALLAVTAIYDKDCELECQISRGGGEWEEAAAVNGNIPYIYEERKLMLPYQITEENDAIRIRVRYRYPPEIEEQGMANETGWSNILQIGKPYAKTLETISTDQGKEEAVVTARQLRPYNICLTILLFVVDLILVLLIVFTPKEKHD